MGQRRRHCTRWPLPFGSRNPIYFGVISDNSNLAYVSNCTCPSRSSGICFPRASFSLHGECGVLGFYLPSSPNGPHFRGRIRAHASPLGQQHRLLCGILRRKTLVSHQSSTENVTFPAFRDKKGVSLASWGLNGKAAHCTPRHRVDLWGGVT